MVQHALMAKRCKGTYTKDHHTSLRNHLKEHSAAKKQLEEDQRIQRYNKNFDAHTLTRVNSKKTEKGFLM